MQKIVVAHFISAWSLAPPTKVEATCWRASIFQTSRFLWWGSQQPTVQINPKTTAGSNEKGYYKYWKGQRINIKQRQESQTQETSKDLHWSSWVWISLLFKIGSKINRLPSICDKISINGSACQYVTDQSSAITQLVRNVSVWESECVQVPSVANKKKNKNYSYIVAVPIFYLEL